MTEPDQRDKAPEPADKWVSAATRIQMNPDPGLSSERDREGAWEEVLAEQQDEQQDVSPEEVQDEDSVEAGE